MPEQGEYRNSDRLVEALRHVEMGFGAFSVWSTTPEGVCRCPKGRECTSAGKHPIPRDGFNAMSRDPKVVTTMLSAGSNPNYGLVWPDGDDIVVVLDVDGADWQARIAELKAKYGPLPATKTTKTPSGGLHLFYRWPKGIPIPDTNHLHGFVIRFPMKGYVVGPLSAINGKVYTTAGPDEIAVLPPTWAATTPTPATRPMIVVEEGKPAYEMPIHVPTGTRHDEIARLVASLWNKRVERAVIEAGVRALAERFDDPMEPQRLKDEIDHAWDTAQKKWVDPAAGENRTETGSEVPASGGRTTVEVGLLDADAPVVPIAMHADAMTGSVQLATLLAHFEPRTDAGKEGLLVTSLVYLGALMGHTPSCFYGSREQHTSFFAMLVGSTGRSRKGTTVDLVRSALAQCTEATRGLKQSPNSGEGLIALAEKAKGEPILVEEEEFDRFIKAKGRDGSTLSSILRQAFDDVPLSSATVSRVLRAPVHHIAMLGNVTREEIVGGMAQVDLKNGFANRILWTGVFPRDTQVSVHDNVLSTHLRDELRDVIAWSRGLTKPLIGGVTHQIDDRARDALLAASARYNDGVGMAPFLCRRLDTIAARIALVYACLDFSRVITIDHVLSALAVTDYAKASASWVFPETTGDAHADLLLRHLRVAGFLGAREIEALIGKRAVDRQHAADALMLMGYARIAERPRSDGKPGRPSRGLEIIP